MWSRTAISSCSGSTCKDWTAWTTRAAARRAVWRVNSQRSENWSGRIHFARTEVRSWGSPTGRVPLGTSRTAISSCSGSTCKQYRSVRPVHAAIKRRGRVFVRYMRFRLSGVPSSGPPGHLPPWVGKVFDCMTCQPLYLPFVIGRLRRSGRAYRAMSKFFLVLFLTRKRTREKGP